MQIQRLTAALGKYWVFLTEPSASVTGIIARRQARFLASVLLALGLTGIAGLLLHVPNRPDDAPLLIGLSLLLIINYTLSRSQYYSAGAVTTVWTFLALNIFAILTAETYETPFIMSRMSWVILTLLIGMFFLTVRQVIFAFAAYLLAFFTLPLLIPPLSYGEIYIPLIYFGVSAMMTVIIRRQFIQVEKDRLAAMKQKQGSLAKAVAERTDELSVLNDELLRRVRIHRDLLEAANSLLINLDVDTLLRDLAEAAHTVLGYDLVVVNIVKDGGEEVRMAAHVGLPVKTADALATSGIPMTWTEFLQSLDERHRIGQNAFFQPAARDNRNEPEENHNRRWDPQDTFFALITISSGETVGLISVDQPVNERRPAPETVQALDLFANLAAIAIQNSRNYQALQHELSERQRAEAILAKAHQELQEKSEALDHSNQELQTLLYVMSHDLKEPLRAIRNFARIVQKRYASVLDEPGNVYLYRIARAGDRLHSLLVDILTLSRIDVQPAMAEVVDSREIVNEVLTALSNEIKDARAEISVADDLPFICVNRAWAARAIQNVIGNALKFHRAGEVPQIEIEPFSENGASGLAVLDRGPGVPPGMEEAIFELFRRGVDHGVEGTGAGLAIVRRIARQNGGDAWYEPRPGGGAIFKLSFHNHIPVQEQVTEYNSGIPLDV